MQAPRQVIPMLELPALVLLPQLALSPQGAAQVLVLAPLRATPPWSQSLVVLSSSPPSQAEQRQPQERAVPTLTMVRLSQPSQTQGLRCREEPPVWSLQVRVPPALVPQVRRPRQLYRAVRTSLRSLLDRLRVVSFPGLAPL